MPTKAEHFANLRRAKRDTRHATRQTDELGMLRKDATRLLLAVSAGNEDLARKARHRIDVRSHRVLAPYALGEPNVPMQ